MQINISNLSQGNHTYELHAEPQDLGVQDHFRSGVGIHVDIEKMRGQLLLDAAIDCGEGHFRCDRCVEDFSRKIKARYRKVFVIRDEDAAGINVDEVEILTTDTNIIDLTHDVRDAILLAIPLKLLCREDCAGLCPRCGQNLNLGRCDCPPAPHDERWEPLGKLLGH